MEPGVLSVNWKEVRPENSEQKDTCIIQNFQTATLPRKIKVRDEIDPLSSSGVSSRLRLYVASIFSSENMRVMHCETAKNAYTIPIPGTFSSTRSNTSLMGSPLSNQMSFRLSSERALRTSRGPSGILKSPFKYARRPPRLRSLLHMVPSRSTRIRRLRECL